MAFYADVVAPDLQVTMHRRQRPRHGLRSLAYVRLDQGNGGIVRDLTELGIAIQAVAPMQPGQHVAVRFDLLSPRVRVETHGRVVWADANGQAGIQFDELPARMRRALRDWLFHQMLSTAAIAGRDTIFAVPDPQFMISEAVERPAIVLHTPALENRRPEIPQVRWGFLSLSARRFSMCVDILVLLCAVLLFALSSLVIMGSVPAWPLATALVLAVSTIFAAVYQLLFSDLLYGATPGRRLAMLATNGANDEDPAPRFR